MGHHLVGSRSVSQATTGRLAVREGPEWGIPCAHLMTTHGNLLLKLGEVWIRDRKLQLYHSKISALMQACKDQCWTLKLRLRLLNGASELPCLFYVATCQCFPVISQFLSRTMIGSTHWKTLASSIISKLFP